MRCAFYKLRWNARYRLLNGLFKWVFGVNRDCKWSVHFTSTVVGAAKLRIGIKVEESLMTSGGCYIQAVNGISIDDDTILAPGVKIISGTHDPRNLQAPCLPCNPIRIGKRCWIGTNAIILPGVELGDDVTVGAGAVVTKSFRSGSTVVGNPARQLDGYREAETTCPDELTSHEAMST